MKMNEFETRYGVNYDPKARLWQVRDRYLADQVMGVHRTETAAFKHADQEERLWSLYRSPAEEVALMMA